MRQEFSARGWERLHTALTPAGSSFQVTAHLARGTGDLLLPGKPPSMPLTRILLLWGLPKPISLHWSGLKRPEMSCPGHWAVEEHQAPGRNLCQQKKNELLSLSTLSSLLSSATPDSPSTDHLHQGQASSGKWERKKKGLIKGD